METRNWVFYQKYLLLKGKLRNCFFLFYVFPDVQILNMDVYMYISVLLLDKGMKSILKFGQR